MYESYGKMVSYVCWFVKIALLCACCMHENNNAEAPVVLVLLSYANPTEVSLCESQFLSAVPHTGVVC